MTGVLFILLIIVRYSDKDRCKTLVLRGNTFLFFLSILIL